MCIMMIILFAAVLVLLWKNYRIKKEAKLFAEKVEDALDAIVTGKEWNMEEEGMIAKILCHFQVGFAVFALWWTIKSGNFLSGDLLIQFFNCLDFFRKGFHCRNL